MTEFPSASLPPSSTSQKTNPWIIVVVVLVVLCCGCFGVIGLLIAFVPGILHELGLTSWLPLLVTLV